MAAFVIGSALHIHRFALCRSSACQLLVVCRLNCVGRFVYGRGRGYKGASRMWSGQIIAFHVFSPDRSHQTTTGDGASFYRFVFVVAGPHYGDQIRSESVEPDVSTFVGCTGFAGYRSVFEPCSHTGSFLNHILHDRDQSGHRLYPEDFVHFRFEYFYNLTTIVFDFSQYLRRDFDTGSSQGRIGAGHIQGRNRRATQGKR